MRAKKNINHGNKSIAVANQLKRKQTNDKCTLQFANNRLEAVAQNKLSAIINNPVPQPEINRYAKGPIRPMPIQKASDMLIQRHAYWPADASWKVTTNVPVGNQPGGRFIRRDGASLDHRLFNRVQPARNNARQDSGWGDNGLISRFPTAGNDTGKGHYQYNTREPANPADIAGNIPIVAKHDQDDQAELTKSNNGANEVTQDRVKHFHAAKTIIHSDIHQPGSTAEQPHYNRQGREHYFVNPFAT